MRTIWKGYLKVSMVTIPIKMFNATTTKRPINFNLLHEKCHTRVRQQNVCPNCEKTLSRDEIIRGYRYGKDMYVIVTDEDLEKAKKESTDVVEVLKFVDESQIDPVYYSDAYYLAPDGKIGFEPFALFLKALAATKKAALGKVVLRNREYMFSIKPHDGAMIAYALRHQEEIQAVDKIEEREATQEIKIDKQSMSMAKTIIQNLSGDFKPQEFVDEYTQTLMEIIKARAEGEEIEVAAEEEKEKVINLMDALKESVEKTQREPKKAMATAGGRKKEERKRKKA
jgi:DNA end-binding protein Ku